MTVLQCGLNLLTSRLFVWLRWEQVRTGFYSNILTSNNKIVFKLSWKKCDILYSKLSSSNRLTTYFLSVPYLKLHSKSIFISTFVSDPHYSSLSGANSVKFLSLITVAKIKFFWEFENLEIMNWYKIRISIYYVV